MSSIAHCAIVAAAVMTTATSFAQGIKFIPLGRNGDTMETRTGLWFSPDLGTPDSVLPLKTRVWATKESVTGGVALKCVFEKGSRGLMVMEYEGYPAGAAGLTFYAKASRPLRLKVINAMTEIGVDWKKIDLPVAKLGEMTWRGVMIGLADPVEEQTWLIIDRIGFEAPDFDPNPAITPQAGPDETISSSNMLYGAEHLAKVRAKLDAKQPLKIIAVGDSITAGVQISRSNPRVRGPATLPFHYFAHLATLLEEHFGYKGITTIQHGKGSTATLNGIPVVEKEVSAEAEPGDLVILQYGANDMGGRGHSPEQWKANMKTLIGKVRAATKTDQVLVMSPTVGGAIPGKSAGITQALKELCAEEKVAGADITRLSMYRGEPFAWAFLANQYHPNLMGHIIMAEMMAPILTGKHRNYPE